MDSYDSDKLLTPEKLRWVLVDLDSTLAEPVWPARGIGRPKLGAEEALRAIQHRGYKVVVYTSRPWADYVAIENWLNDNNLPFNKIICGKVLAKLIIDDTAFRLKSWRRDIDKILELL